MPDACGIILYEEQVVLLKTPGQSSGVVNIRAQSSLNNTQQGSVSFTTNCPYLTMPSGAYVVPAGGGGSVEFSFAFNLAAHDTCGVGLCGSITATINNGDGCVSTVQIPVWVWNACGQNDVLSQCGFLIPNGLHINLQDSSTWDLKLPVLADFGYNHPAPVGDGRNYLADFTIVSESCGVFPSGSRNKQFVFDKTGQVFEYDLNLEGIDPSTIECGQDVLLCEIRILVDSGLDPVMAACQRSVPYAEIVVPLYVTNECPQRSCPISWTSPSQSINKNAGDTGTMVPFIQNNGSSIVTVTFESSCDFVNTPDPVQVQPGGQQFVSLQYDVSEFSTCGVTQCGVITASVTYNNGDVCERVLPISIAYECPGPESDGYKTKLYDEGGESSVEVSGNCSSIAIVDMSDFGTMGHAVSNFTGYRKIAVKHLQSGEEHVMSSVADGNEDIPAASTGTFAFEYAITPGGVFEVTLCQVPTWNASSSFQADDDVVFLNGKMYAAIADSQGVNPETSPLSATNWLEIPFDELDEYSDKYCDTQVVLSSCDIDQCFTSRYVRMACELDCNALDLCKNKEWLEINKLFFLITALAEARAQNNVTAAVSIYDKAKSICNC
jgi:hypothetical protein